MASNSGGVDTGLVSVTNLGVGGVNLVKNPLEMADNEVLLAQNAEPYREQGVAGVRKRPGLQRVSGAAISPIIGIGPISQPTDPSTPTLDIPPLSSPDGGTTWSPGSGPGDGTLLPNVKYTLSGSPYEFVTSYAACWCQNSRVYVIGGHAPGQILVVSSTVNVKGITVFTSSTNDDTLVLPYPYYDAAGKEWAVVVTVAGTVGQILLYAPATGDTLVLPTLSSTPIATGAQGYGQDSQHWYLWVANGANISSIRPGVDTSWTDNAVGAAGETMLGLLLYGAYLVAGTKQSGTGGPRIIRCLMSGNTVSVSGSVTWSTGGGPTYAFGPFTIFGQLYACVFGGNAATLSGTDAGAADIVDSRQILKATGALATTPNWRANEAQGGLDVQLDTNAFNGSSNRVMGPILGFTGQLPTGFWYGWSVQGVSNVLSIAKSFYGLLWTFPSVPQVFSSNPIWPLMIF